MLEYEARLKVIEQTYVVELIVDNQSTEHPIFRVSSDGTVVGVNASGKDYLSYEGCADELRKLIIKKMSEVDETNLKVLL